VRDMPCGLCPVCDDPVDLAEAGICKRCGNAFHWNHCGGWVGGQHVCENCEQADEDEDDEGGDQ
jgi:hypothetical protein